MKKSQLIKIIKEEITKVISENPRTLSGKLFFEPYDLANMLFDAGLYDRDESAQALLKRSGQKFHPRYGKLAKIVRKVFEYAKVPEQQQKYSLDNFAIQQLGFIKPATDLPLDSRTKQPIDFDISAIDSVAQRIVDLYNRQSQADLRLKARQRGAK